MVDESIALFEEMHICEENGLQILCSKALSRTGEVSRIWWGSDRAERWASVAADNLRSYVTVILEVLEEGRVARDHGCYNRED
jgi:hypothetical protein